MIIPTSHLRVRRALVSALLSLLAAAACSEAEHSPGADPNGELAGPPVRTYYQFIDGDGLVQFAEKIEDVPAAWRDRVGFVELSTPPPLIAGQRPVPGTPGSDTPVRNEAGAEPVAVRLYYAEWCGFCRRAKAHLERRGVQYELLDVDIAAVRQELFDKTGQKGVPVIDVGGQILRGYSEVRLEEMLREASLL